METVGMALMLLERTLACSTQLLANTHPDQALPPTMLNQLLLSITATIPATIPATIKATITMVVALTTTATMAVPITTTMVLSTTMVVPITTTVVPITTRDTMVVDVQSSILFMTPTVEGMMNFLHQCLNQSLKNQ